MQQQQHSCGNGTCCSPSKLWRQLQNIIRTGNEQAFSELCGDEDRARHVARVLFRQRLDNDPSMYPASHKHRVLQLEDITYDQKLQFKHYFGTSVKDLNGLQLALFFKKESFAKKLLNFLYHHQEQQQLSSNEFQSFINHTWGNKNTSLHLACFLGMPSLVALLLKLGAHPNPINLKNYGPLDGCTNNQCIQLIKKNKKNNLSPIKTTKTATVQKQRQPSSLEFKPLSIHLYPQQQLQPQKDLAQTSMLLKKAVQQVSELPMDHLLSANLTTTTAKPSLVFSSSTSSSSSFSSASSLDDQQQQQQRQQLPSLPPSPLTPTTPDLILDDGYSFHCWSPPLTPPPSSSMKSFNINDTTSSLPQPDPSYYRTIRPPMPLKSPPPPPSPTSFQEEEEEEEEKEDGQVQDVDNIYQDQKEKESAIASSSPKLTSILKDPTTATLKKKRVSFQPDILMVDICKQGNVNDLIHLIKDHLDNDDDEDSDFSLSSSLFLKWQQDYFSKEGTMKTLPSMLHLAVLHNNEKMVHFLIYKLIGINVNALDQEGFTPLHYAATLGLWKLVHLLAHHPKIVLNLKTKNGLTIYDCPRTLFDKRKCKNVLDHAKKLHLQQQQSV
ncbi:ankyrin repeat-containing domain protein [Cunninghamella echinulata]|nr:ankyrin repeat-containing domain protein [Cunninghamella echinulata]